MWTTMLKANKKNDVEKCFKRGITFLRLDNDLISMKTNNKQHEIPSLDWSPYPIESYYEPIRKDNKSSQLSPLEKTGSFPMPERKDQKHLKHS